jgi:hypothetical protein
LHPISPDCRRSRHVAKASHFQPMASITAKTFGHIDELRPLPGPFLNFESPSPELLLHS